MKTIVEKLVENQLNLQKHVKLDSSYSKEQLLERFHTAIFVECGEAINETDFKWWKYKKVEINKLKEELADIFIFALDLSLLTGEELEVLKLLQKDKIERGFHCSSDCYDYMVNRLKEIPDRERIFQLDKHYGIYVMEKTMDIIEAYGYIDFFNVVHMKQMKNIMRQETGYNKSKEIKKE